MTTISAIIPATDDPDTLDRCIAALRRGREAPDEVIVVQEPACAYAGTARNLGAGRASGDVLLFVDADLVAVAAAPFAVLRYLREQRARGPVRS